jgi:beta-carotene 3-hydroxylase
MHILITIVSFFLMEAVAWLAHKYIMHNVLWVLHKDHHQPNQNSHFEKNDFFFLIFATPGIIFIYLGFEQHFNYYFWIGLGISLYGFAYFIIHDVFIHQRLKWLRNSNFFYFKAIRKAHKMHHKHLGKEDGECFGMLIFPLKYIKEAYKSK